MDSRFTELLAPYLPVLGERPLTEDANLRDLGLDSMRSIDLLFDIKDVFAVALPDEDLNDTTFETAGSLWQAVSAAVSDEAAA